MARTRRDPDLVRRAASGDADAFMAILQQHDQRLRTLATRLLAGDHHAVDDVLQDAYVQAYRAVSAFRHDADIGTWLYRITYNACVDELRRSNRRPRPANASEALRHTPTEASEPDVQVTAAETVRLALAALPDDQRAAVVLVDGEGLDHEAAANMLGIPRGTVASRLSRGRTAFRRHIGEEHQ